MEHLPSESTLRRTLFNFRGLKTPSVSTHLISKEADPRQHLFSLGRTLYTTVRPRCLFLVRENDASVVDLVAERPTLATPMDHSMGSYAGILSEQGQEAYLACLEKIRSGEIERHVQDGKFDANQDSRASYCSFDLVWKSPRRNEKGEPLTCTLCYVVFIETNPLSLNLPEDYAKEVRFSSTTSGTVTKADIAGWVVGGCHRQICTLSRKTVQNILARLEPDGETSLSRPSFATWLPSVETTLRHRAKEQETNRRGVYYDSDEEYFSDSDLNYCE